MSANILHFFHSKNIFDKKLYHSKLPPPSHARKVLAITSIPIYANKRTFFNEYDGLA